MHATSAGSNKVNFNDLTFSSIHPGRYTPEPGDLSAFVSMKQISELPIDRYLKQAREHFKKNPLEDEEKRREDPDKRVRIQVGEIQMYLLEDPEERKAHAKMLAFIENSVLNKPEFFDQDVGKIEATVRMTHFLMADKTKALRGERGGTYRKKEMAFTTHMHDQNLKKCLIKTSTGCVWDRKKLSELGYSFFIPPPPSEIEAQMVKLSSKIKELGSGILQGSQDPIDAAARIHMGLVRNHFFEDGNGRLARGWMNTFLRMGGEGEVYFPSSKEYDENVMRGLKEEEDFSSYLRRHCSIHSPTLRPKGIRKI